MFHSILEVTIPPWHRIHLRSAQVLLSVRELYSASLVLMQDLVVARKPADVPVNNEAVHSSVSSEEKPRTADAQPASVDMGTAPPEAAVSAASIAAIVSQVTRTQSSGSQSRQSQVYTNQSKDPTFKDEKCSFFWFTYSSCDARSCCWSEGLFSSAEATGLVGLHRLSCQVREICSVEEMGKESPKGHFRSSAAAYGQRCMHVVHLHDRGLVDGRINNACRRW